MNNYTLEKLKKYFQIPEALQQCVSFDLVNREAKFRKHLNSNQEFEKKFSQDNVIWEYIQMSATKFLKDNHEKIINYAVRLAKEDLQKIKKIS